MRRGHCLSMKCPAGDKASAVQHEDLDAPIAGEEVDGGEDAGQEEVNIYIYIYIP
jgi:hypothetical protein